MTDAPIYIKPDIGFVLSVKVWIQPDKVDDFWALFRPAYDAVIAEQECRFFIVDQDLNEPGAFSWVEGWTKDPVWLQTVQMAKPYYEPYRTDTAKMYSKPMEFRITSMMDGMAHFKLPLDQRKAELS
jgi:quinol monooxygenase YgiN